MFRLARRVVNKDKIDLIDHAFSSLSIESFADLGAVWRVEGAYTFHTLGKYRVRDAALVDLNVTTTVRDRAKSYPQLRLVSGNFGDQDIVDKVGEVDAVFLFDVLLHQVSPDWDVILEMYSKKANVFVIYNQQWTGSAETVRLLDLGETEYFRNVPHDRRVEEYSDLYRKLNDKHPELGRSWRDFPGIWQWGITDSDLESKVAQLGFELVHRKECGRFGRLRNFQNRAFIFSRKEGVHR